MTAYARALICTLLISGVIQTTTAQCLGRQSTNCGTFCCPPITNGNLESVDSSGNLRDQCCRAAQIGTVRFGCCSNQENQFSNCGGRQCPDYFNSDEVINDDNGRIRSECCRYFRSGCCSTEENNTLELLFQITIGVVVSVTILICLIVPAIFCYCFCTCYPNNMSENKR